MARPKTKQELMDAADLNFEKLWQLVDTMPDVAANTVFNFSADIKKKEAHWNRDKNLRDILIHLYEWHQLLLNWIQSNKSGNKVNFLPEAYSWKTYGGLNIEFWKKHQQSSYVKAREMILNSHNDVMKLIQTFSNEELFTKQFFHWTGTTSLGSYCVSATSSHYDWAIKKLRAHIKNVS